MVLAYLKNLATLTIRISFTSLMYLPALVPTLEALPTLATFYASSVWLISSSESPSINLTKKYMSSGIEISDSKSNQKKKLQR